jgi:magnesium-protoporphyrin IX monomethyl ester (oxidative) cyclase
VSFLAAHLLEQAQDAIDAVVRGEGEPIVGPLLAAAPDRAAHEISGIVTRYVSGPARYELPLPDHQDVRLRQRRELYIHHPRSAIHH